MKDKELKLKETEASHTLGGAGECRLQGKVIYAPLLMKFLKTTNSKKKKAEKQKIEDFKMYPLPSPSDTIFPCST